MKLEIQSGPTDRDRVSIGLRSLAAYLLITFGLSWGVLLLFVLLPEPMTVLTGPISGQHPLFYLAVWAPAIAAFSIVIHRTGIDGLRRFVARVLIWRTSWLWVAFLFVAMPLIFYAGSALNGKLFAEPLPAFTLTSLLAAFALMAVKGPIEEFGWRGFALPLLQRRFAPFWAGSIIGLVWGVWHLPAFLLSGTPQSSWAFTPFLAGTLAMSLIMTAMFNASRGSILLPMIFHFQAINPIWPDAQPYDSVLFVVAAGLGVWCNRTQMFNGAGASIEVVPSHAPVGRDQASQ